MVLSTLSGFLTLLLEARTPVAEMCMYMKPSAEMDGLLPVSRLGGASQVSHCSRCCLTRFQRTSLWERELGRCVAGQSPVLGSMSFQDWQLISLVGQRLIPSAPTHNAPTR